MAARLHSSCWACMPAAEAWMRPRPCCPAPILPPTPQPPTPGMQHTAGMPQRACKTACSECNKPQQRKRAAEAAGPNSCTKILDAWPGPELAQGWLLCTTPQPPRKQAAPTSPITRPKMKHTCTASPAGRQHRAACRLCRMRARAPIGRPLPSAARRASRTCDGRCRAAAMQSLCSCYAVAVRPPWQPSVQPSAVQLAASSLGAHALARGLLGGA